MGVTRQVTKRVAIKATGCFPTVRRGCISRKNERPLTSSMKTYELEGTEPAATASPQWFSHLQNGPVATLSFLLSLFTTPSTPSLCHLAVQPNETAIPGYVFVIKKKEREKNQSFGLFGPSWSSARDARSRAVLKTLPAAVAQTGWGKWLPGNHYGRLTCPAGCLERGCCRRGDRKGHPSSWLGAAFSS